jgi:hypothetical protein
MIADRAILHMLLAGLARTLHVGILVWLRADAVFVANETLLCSASWRNA